MAPSPDMRVIAIRNSFVKLLGKAIKVWLSSFHVCWWTKGAQITWGDQLLVVKLLVVTFEYRHIKHGEV